MAKTFLELIKLVLPLSAEKKKMLRIAEQHLEPEEFKDLKYFLKIDRLFGLIHDYESDLIEKTEWVEFKTHVGTEDIKELIAGANKKIKSEIDERSFHTFSKEAAIKIPQLIANNIVGLENEKLAGALLLFAKEPVHILLLGDPGTGKTEILRSVAALAPKSSFGLGSGTTGAGLSAAAQGKELLLGLLPLADEGVACIDELNLMKTADRAALYSAMEKGFVTYDKGGKHEQLDARVRIIATANPKGDRFVGLGAQILKKQVPFAQALLSRFHLVHMIRRPDRHELGQITRQIVRKEKQTLRKGDVAFVKAYANWAWKQDVSFPKEFEPMVVNAIEDLGEDEKKFLVEVGPRTVVGIIRMSQALARMEGKTEVEKEDLLRILRLVKDVFYVRKN